MTGFVRRGDGIDIGVDRNERRVVAIALRIVEQTDLSDAEEPAAARLGYSAHPDDPDADLRFHRLTDEMLAEARRRDRGICAATLRQNRLSFEEAEAWMRVIGEARLVLGARLGIDQDGWEDGIAPEEASPDLLLLHLLGRVQDDLVGVLLPPG
jgi:hypothetical protein